MKLKRSNKQTALVAFNMVLLLGLSIWNLRDGIQQGSTGLLLLGAVFALWCGFVALNLLRRHFYARIDKDGILVRRITRDVFVPYDRLSWARLQPDARIAVLAYRLEDDTRDRYTGLSTKVIGSEGIAHLAQAVASARPGLPDRAPEAMK